MIISIITTAVVLSIAYGFYRLKNDLINKFQSSAEEGIGCAFYINENRVHGEIVASDDVTVVIKSIFGDFERSRDEIYSL